MHTPYHMFVTVREPCVFSQMNGFHHAHEFASLKCLAIASENIPVPYGPLQKAPFLGSVGELRELDPQILYPSLGLQPLKESIVPRCNFRAKAKFQIRSLEFRSSVTAPERRKTIPGSS